MSLLPPQALVAAARILTEGAKKHDDFGWKSRDPKLYLDAILRHAMEIMAGNETDAEYGELHATHLLADAMIYVELMTEQRKKVAEETIS